jgi:cytochrome c oxidase assembly protein subunit 15
LKNYFVSLDWLDSLHRLPRAGFYLDRVRVKRPKDPSGLSLLRVRSNSDTKISKQAGAPAKGLVGLLLSVLAIGTTGTVAALGDTLFPATSLHASLLQDFTSDSPALLHFRVLHPLLAVIAGAYVVCVALKSSSRRIWHSRPSVALIILLFTEIGIGLLNVLLVVPVWLQILHLLVAETMWISLVLASATSVLETADSRLDSV